MRKKLSEIGRHKFRPMNWWNKLFWEVCLHCKQLFRKEDGWKAGPYINQGGTSSYAFMCKNCCATAEEAEEKYSEQ